MPFMLLIIAGLFIWFILSNLKEKYRIELYEMKKEFNEKLNKHKDVEKLLIKENKILTNNIIELKRKQ